MSDIVGRLRKLVILDEVGSDNPLGREAADEIERLRVDLNEALLDAKRAEPVIAAVGMVVDHDCDEVIHPQCWANILTAYYTYMERYDG